MEVVGVDVEKNIEFISKNATGDGPQNLQRILRMFSWRASASRHHLGLSLKHAPAVGSRIKWKIFLQTGCKDSSLQGAQLQLDYYHHASKTKGKQFFTYVVYLSRKW